MEENIAENSCSAGEVWLDDLRVLAYDVEDILDDFATEALGRKLMAETQASTSKVRRVLIPSSCTSLTPSAVKFNVKIDEVQDRGYHFQIARHFYTEK